MQCLGQIDAQALVLIVVAVDEVGVRALVHEEGIDSLLRFAETDGVHGSHGIVPAPCLVPVPAGKHPVKRVAHVFLVDKSAHGQYAYSPEDSHVV